EVAEPLQRVNHLDDVVARHAEGRGGLGRHAALVATDGRVDEHTQAVVGERVKLHAAYYFTMVDDACQGADRGQARVRRSRKGRWPSHSRGPRVAAGDVARGGRPRRVDA